jgi:hypothetical protein
LIEEVWYLSIDLSWFVIPDFPGRTIEGFYKDSMAIYILEGFKLKWRLFYSDGTIISLFALPLLSYDITNPKLTAETNSKSLTNCLSTVRSRITDNVWGRDVEWITNHLYSVLWQVGSLDFMNDKVLEYPIRPFMLMRTMIKSVL